MSLIGIVQAVLEVIFQGRGLSNISSLFESLTNKSYAILLYRFEKNRLSDSEMTVALNFCAREF